MGGRLDATNVIEPLVSVITDVSLDHQNFLGETVAEIAGEKAGIIRPNGVVVTLPQQAQANDVIGRTIMDLGARAVSAVPYVPPIESCQRAIPDARLGDSRFTLPAAGAGRGNSGRDSTAWPSPTAKCGARDCGCGRTHAARLLGHDSLD